MSVSVTVSVTVTVTVMFGSVCLNLLKQGNGYQSSIAILRIANGQLLIQYGDILSYSIIFLRLAMNESDN